MTNNTEKKIISLVSRSTGIPEKDININSKSNDFDKWDSLANVKIILEIEKMINKRVNVSKMGELTSIKSILNYLK